MNTNPQANDAARVSRREAIRRGLYGTAGVLLADRLGERASAAKPKAKKPAAEVKALELPMV